MGGGAAELQTNEGGGCRVIGTFGGLQSYRQMGVGCRVTDKWGGGGLQSYRQMGGGLQSYRQMGVF